MPDSDAPDELWEGDVNEAVVEEWTDDTTTFDRVQQVIDVTTEPQSANEIAERARVSEPTARKYLDAMSDAGRAKAIRTDAATQYMRSPTVIAMRRIAAIHREHAKAEVRSAVEDLRDELKQLRDDHGVADVDDLALELAAGDDGWQDVARWRQLEENLEIAQAALALYDFDPDDSRSAAARVTGPSRDEVADGERGAFGDEDGETAA